MSGMCRSPRDTVVAVCCDIVAAHPGWSGLRGVSGADGPWVSRGTTGEGEVFLGSRVTGWTVPVRSVRWRCRPRGGRERLALPRVIGGGGHVLRDGVRAVGRFGEWSISEEVEPSR